MRHTSPYTRSHEPDPGSIIKLKKVSQKPIDEELYEVKGDLISSLTEQSIHLKRDLDVKERENIRLKKINATRISSMEDHIQSLEAKKNDLIVKINQTSKEAEHLDRERIDLTREVQKKNEKITDLLKQTQKLDSEYNLNDRKSVSNLTYQEMQEKYLDMLEEREEELKNYNLQIKRLESECGTSEQEIAKLQGEIERRLQKITGLKGDRKEAEVRLQTQEHEIKTLKMTNTELDSEMTILLGEKAKLIAEREVLKVKIDEAKSKAHNALKDILATQAHVEAQLKIFLRSFGLRILSIATKRIETRKLQEVIKKIEIYKIKRISIVGGLSKIAGTIKCIKERFARATLLHLHRSFLKYTRESHLNRLLMQTKLQKRLVFRSWIEWKKLAELTAIRKENRFNAISGMAKTFWTVSKRFQREFIYILKSRHTKCETRIMALHSIFMKKSAKEYQRVFLQWKRFIYLKDLEIQKMQYGDCLADARFLSYFLNRLKDNAAKMKRIKHNLIKHQFEHWYGAYKMKKLEEEYEVKAEEISKLREQKLLCKTFHYWEGIMIESKGKKMSKHTEERASEYQINQNLLKTYQENNQNKIKNNCFRTMNMLLKQDLHYYMHRWYIRAKNHTNKMEYALNCISRVHEKSLRHNLLQWKSFSTNSLYKQVLEENNRAVERSVRLQSQIAEASDRQQDYEQNKVERNFFVLERIAQRYRRNLIFNYFKKFDDNCRKDDHEHYKYNKGCLKIRKAFLKYHHRVFTNSLEEYLNKTKLTKLCESFLDMKERQLKAINRIQKARQIISRSITVRFERIVSKRFYKWVHAAKHLKNNDSKQVFQRLETIYRSRTIELEREVQSNNEIELNTNAYEQKAVNAKCAYVWNLLFQSIYLLKTNNIRRWREHAKGLSLKRRGASKMATWIQHYYGRLLLQRTIAFGDSLQAFRAKESLDSTLLQRKHLKLKVSEEKNRGDLEFQQKESLLQDTTASRDKILNSYKFVSKRLSGRLGEEQNYQLALETFTGWKERIHNYKRVLNAADRTIVLNLQREAFFDLKESTENKRAKERQKNIILKWVRSIHKARTENALEVWKKFTLKKRRLNIRKEWMLTNKGLESIGSYLERTKENGTRQTVTRYEQKMIRKYFAGLKEGAILTKRLRRIKDKMAEKLRQDTKQTFFRQIFSVLTKKKVTKNIVHNALQKNKFRAMRSLFMFWREEVWKMKTFNKVLSRYEVVFEKWNNLFAFRQLKEHSIRKRHTSELKERSTAYACFNFTHSLTLLTLRESFSAFIQNLGERAVVRQRLKELFITAQKRKVVSHFLRWKRKVASIALVEKSSIEGNLYERKKDIENEIKYLNKFAVAEGYEPEDLEQYHTQKELENFSLMQKGVSRLILGSSGLTVVNKALNSWKEFVVRRKAIKYLSNRMLKYLREPDLISSFSRWRNLAAQEREHEEILPKTEIKHRIITLKNQEFFLKNHVQEIQNTVSELEIRVEIQTRELDVAKVLAVKTLGRIEGMFTRKYFEILKTSDREYRESLKVDMSDSAREKILKLQRQIKQLELEHKSLFKDNEMLRAVSLQGLDVTNAIQELSKDRDNLGRELESKNLTIQKLVNENRSLATRLNSAQKEAEDLIKYTKEFLQPTINKGPNRNSSKNGSPLSKYYRSLDKGFNKE